MSEPLEVTDTVVLPASDLSWTSARASGPGGQKVNKTASKVRLRFDLAGTTALSDAVKARLRHACAGRLDSEGRLVVVSSRTREQARNLEDARARLVELVRAALEAPVERRATRPSRGARRRRLESKRRRARIKAQRRAPQRDD